MGINRRRLRSAQDEYNNLRKRRILLNQSIYDITQKGSPEDLSLELSKIFQEESFVPAVKDRNFYSLPSGRRELLNFTRGFFPWDLLFKGIGDRNNDPKNKGASYQISLEYFKKYNSIFKIEDLFINNFSFILYISRLEEETQKELIKNIPSNQLPRIFSSVDASKEKKEEQLEVLNFIYYKLNLNLIDNWSFYCRLKGFDVFFDNLIDKDSSSLIACVNKLQEYSSFMEDGVAFTLWKKLYKKHNPQMKASYDSITDLKNLPSKISWENIVSTDNPLSLWNIKNKQVIKATYELITNKTESGAFYNFASANKIEETQSQILPHQYLKLFKFCKEKQDLKEKFKHFKLLQDLIKAFPFLDSPNLKDSFFNYIDLWEDTSHMLKRLKDGYIFDVENRSPFDFLKYTVEQKGINNIKKLHDALPALLSPVKSTNFFQVLPLAQPSLRGYDLVLAKDSKELEEVGKKLKICVGNGVYAESVTRGTCKILLLKKNNNTCYCVEVRGNKIIQFKGTRNFEAAKDFNEELQRVINGEVVQESWWNKLVTYIKGLF